MSETDRVNILIVDDQPANLLSLASLLAGPDRTVLKAASGNEALALLLEYDVVTGAQMMEFADLEGLTLDIRPEGRIPR